MCGATTNHIYHIYHKTHLTHGARKNGATALIVCICVLYVTLQNTHL